jgi:DNA-directed RNA polymerase specialized sigma subunit
VEFMRVYKEGRPCVVGKSRIPASDALFMMTPKEVEEELLQQFSKLIKSATRRVASKHNMDGCELTAEAYEAFFRAMLNYNGSTRFSTFLHFCLHRNLTRALSDDSIIRVPRKVRKLSMRVVDFMHSGKTFDEATKEFKNDDVKKIVASMRKVQGAGDLQMDESELATVEESQDFKWVRKALEGVHFTRLEQEALRGFMESPAGVMGLSSNLKNLVNPATGKPYSRAAVSTAWAQARKKIKVALEAA